MIIITESDEMADVTVYIDSPTPVFYILSWQPDFGVRLIVMSGRAGFVYRNREALAFWRQLLVDIEDYIGNRKYQVSMAARSAETCLETLEKKQETADARD